MKKFYAVIGNPPYQEQAEGTSDKPIFNFFMDEAYKIGDTVELITPGRFLFNAGKTPRDWNLKMLNDSHLKVLNYTQLSSEVFPGTDIKGGVAVTFRDSKIQYGPIKTFSQYKELNSIQRKIISSDKNVSITTSIILQNRFNLDALYTDYPEAEQEISSNGRENA